MPSGTVKPATFQWLLPRRRELIKSVGTRIASPEFHLADSRWYLSLYFYPDQHVNIFLHRGDFGESKTITYTITIYDRFDVKEISKTSHFNGNNYRFGGEIYSRYAVDLNSSLLITCYIKCNTAQPVSGREFVTCASRTEAANSVTEKENKNDEDLSSLDIKGIARLSERMKELLIKSSDHDVTICVQDKEFRAHRSILSTRSPVFAMMFAHDTKENNTGTISIGDCDPESFDQFLLYVYSGRTENLTPSNAIQLYYTADKYDFPVLKELCMSLLKTSLSVESICDVVLLAARHQEKELLEVATEFFARNVKGILVSVGWKNFLLQNPDEANELYIKSMEILLPKN